MRVPEAASNPFFLMAPEEFRLPLVILATLATIIASQAMITGAFSVVQQSVQLGMMPRLKITHTSASAYGQIYVPVVNWVLMVLVLLLVLTFQKSSNLAAAYGIAVMGTMFISTMMIGVLTAKVWNWPKWRVYLVTGTFLIIDGAYLSSNLIKVPEGGWLPLLVAAIIFMLLTTWAKGRELMIARLREAAMPVKVFIQSAASSATRVTGTAVFMTSASDGVPHALLHNLKHNKVLHERVLLVSVKTADTPETSAAERVRVIVGEEVEHFLVESTSRQAAPLVALMHGAADRVRSAELERFAGRFAELDDTQRSAVESLTKAIVAKLLHEPSVRVLNGLAHALNVPSEKLLAYLGRHDSAAAERSTESAIATDDRLSETQKQSLLDVYRAFIAANDVVSSSK